MFCSRCANSTCTTLHASPSFFSAFASIYLPRTNWITLKLIFFFLSMHTPNKSDQKYDSGFRADIISSVMQSYTDSVNTHLHWVVWTSIAYIRVDGNLNPVAIFKNKAYDEWLQVCILKSYAFIAVPSFFYSLTAFICVCCRWLNEFLFYSPLITSTFIIFCTLSSHISCHSIAS